MLHARHGNAIMAIVAVASAMVVAGHEGDADACGACYANQSESTIVNDHRMALSITQNMTVLWDQIAYSGNPSQFAYVIPARRGTRLEVSNDGWFAALDASTRPIIMAPKNQSYGGGGGYRGDGPYRGGASTGGEGSGGCCGSSEDSAMFAESGPQFGADAGAASGASPENQADPVQILSQEVVGPYETVTLRSEDPSALFDWLAANEFSIPEESKPIVEEYVEAGLDFIAMRMRPPSAGAQTRAMEPIRILVPGSDPTLPLRMMRIGSGANLGITLFVIGESRYRAKTFPNVAVDESKIVWDYSKNKSNYLELATNAMTAGDSRGWLTEYAQKPNLYRTGSVGMTGMIGNPGLADAYEQTCPSFQPYAPSDASTAFDSSVPKKDASTEGGIADAGADDDAGEDAGEDAGVDAGPEPTLPARPPRTKQCDDLTLATETMDPANVWVTRMRAFLPNAAMDEPLTLEPVPTNGIVDNVHYAATSGTVSARIAPSNGTRGTWAIIVAAGLVLRGIIKRRRKS